jgi:hypothetical protein
VKVQNIMACTSLGESFHKFGTDFPVMEGHFEFGAMFWELAGRLLAEEKIRPQNFIFRWNGLRGIWGG